jgi:hypothetical protein
MDDAPARDAKAAHIEAYKTVLRQALDQRPSGTRQRLATALGKNRSFISHMTSPWNSAPIPAPHLDLIFKICRFSAADKVSFLKSFNLAHPNRLKKHRESASLRSLKVEVVDFGDENRNRAFDQLIRDTARRFARLIATGE